MQPLTRSRPRSRFFGASGPSFALDFVNGTNALDPRVTFTRASSATFFNSAGVLQSAAIDVPRFDYNPSTLAARGFLIEESRTNLALYSEEFDNVGAWAATGAGGTITANQSVAPDGNTTADQLTFTASTFSGVRQNVTLTAVSYTLSCWMRSVSGTAIARLKYFNGTIDTFSNNFALTTTWQRFSLTFTGVAAAGNISINNGTTGVIQDIYIWGAQLEAGAFPTSYIPTTTTALTRAADVASVNTLSPWYNAAEGTLFAEGTYIGLIVARQLAALTDNTTSNLISVQTNPSTATVARGSVIVSGSAQASLNGPAGSITAGVTTKMAIAYKTDDFAFSVGGNTPATDSLGTLPVVNRLQIGAAGTAYSTAYLRRITYYPRKLSSAELQTLTT